MTHHLIRAPILAILAGSAFLLGAPLASAQQVNWSVTVGTPVQPVYAPAPVYVQPQRVYVAPAPVYVQPERVYAPPVYVQPYSAPVAVVQYRSYPTQTVYVEGGDHHGYGHHGRHHGWHRD